MPLSRTRWSIILAVVASLGVAVALYANRQSLRAQQRERAEAITGGNAEQGQVAFYNKGCGSCHAVKNQPQAAGLVGPPLDGLDTRAVIAGKLENTPANLTEWIRNPQGVIPGNAMPNLPMTAQDSRDMAAFLYSLP